MMNEGKQTKRYEIRAKTQSGAEMVFSTTDILEIKNSIKLYTHTTLTDLIYYLSLWSGDKYRSGDPVVSIEQTGHQVGCNDLIQVHVSLIKGRALDFALAHALNGKNPLTGADLIYMDGGDIMTGVDGEETYAPWSPATDFDLTVHLMRHYQLTVGPTSNNSYTATNDINGGPGTFRAPGATYEEAICSWILISLTGPTAAIPSEYEQLLVG